MYFDFRTRWLDNADYRGAHVRDGIIQSESAWQAFVKICDDENHRLYRNGKWEGCTSADEAEVKENIMAGCSVHLCTDGDWDFEVSLAHVTKEDAYEVVKTITFPKHILMFDVKLHVEKEDPSIDAKCKLKVYVAHDERIRVFIVDVDFECDKLLFEDKDKAIDADEDYDNIGEVFKQLREFLSL